MTRVFDGERTAVHLGSRGKQKFPLNTSSFSASLEVLVDLDLE